MANSHGNDGVSTESDYKSAELVAKTDEERALLAAWRAADSATRQAVLEVLQVEHSVKAE